MMNDMQVSSKAKGTGKYAKKTAEPETVSDMEDAEEDEESPDEANDEDAEIDAAFEEGLKARYEAVLQTGGASAAAKSAGIAFMRRSPCPLRTAVLAG